MIQPNTFPDVLVPDTTPPELLSFNLNLTSEVLTLSFSETVDYTTFETRFITFVNDPENSTVSVSLNNIVGESLFTQENLPYMQFRIAADDVDRLQAETRVGTGFDDTFIIVDSSLVRDTSGNMIVQIFTNDSLGVTNFTADSIVPMFLGFTQLDMDEGIITLSFSEPMEAESIIFSAFSLHNVATGDNISFSLTGGSTMYADAVRRSLQILLSPQDLRSVKLLQQLAVTQDTSYLSFADGAINDTAQNPIDGILSSMSVQAEDYIGDETRPLLLNFTLDMNDGLLELTFDDVFDRETLMPQHITLQSESATEPNSSYTLQQGSSISPDGFSISINLAKIDLDEIKMRSQLATSRETTYISLSSQIGRDIAGNPVTAIVIDEAVQALNFTEDTTDPFLERFSLDLNVEVSGIDRGTITLVFNEAINVTSLNLRELTLQNTQNGSESSEMYRLTGGDLNPPVTGVTIVVTLTKFDTDNLKELTFLGTTVNDTYISFPDTFVADMNSNPIIPIDQSNGTMAFSLTADINPPELIKFSLDLDAPCLELTFSETVNVSSLDPTRIILQSSTEDPPLSSFQLTGGNVTSINDTVVRVCFTLSDANNVKRLRELATSPMNTFLRFEFGMVYDNAGNAIQEIAPSSAVQILVDCYTEDTTRPQLPSFDLDLDSDMLTLSFTETVSMLEFNFTGIIITGGLDPDSDRRQLTGGNITSGDNDIVVIILTFDDLNYIKNNSMLATEASNTFILIDNTTTFDMNMNSVEQILVPVLVQNYTADAKSPALLSYEFDLNQGTLTLSFSETVDASSLDVTGIQLHDETSPLFTLTNSSATDSSDGPVIVVTISAVDLNNIKQIVSLATSINSTFLTITQNTINDTSQNMVEEIVTPLQAAQFTLDTTPPMLLSFRLDMNNTVPPLLIVLTFSETVRSNSLSPQEFMLRISANDTSSNASFTLTGGSVSSINSTEITITVNSSDLEEIRLRPPLGHYVNTTYLSITDAAVMDMAGLSVVTISQPALPAANNDADLVPPFLSEFSFDLDLGSLVLTFSEDVILSSLVINQITLLDSAVDSKENFTLANSTSSQLTGNEIQVNLTTEELNEVKILTSLASSAFTTFISLEPNTINDIAGNDALPTTALRVQTFTPDTTRPQLLAFNFSLATREVTLVFSETVNASSINPSGIIFVSSDSATPEESHQLTGGVVRSDDGTEIVIQLTVPDKNAIKAFTMLAVSNDSLFISILPQLVADNAGNLVVQIPTSSAIPVSTFTPDLDRPSLLSFDLDMDGGVGVLTLHFNETVNTDTLMIDNFTLQDNSTFIAANYTLNTSTVQATNAADVAITLSMFDFNEIKRRRLCYAVSVCYLVMEEGAVLDMVEMPVAGIPDGSALQVSNLTNDTTSPDLREFTYINLDTQTIRLSFSETVNASSLNFTNITLVDIFNPSIASVTLTGGSTNDDDRNIIEFTLESSDVEQIKTNNFLCTHRGNCYITFTSAFVRDMVGNAISPVPIQFPGYPVMFYEQDGVLPQLSNFTLNMNSGVLTLTFDEPVSAASLEPTGITIQSNSSSVLNGAYSHTLSGGTTTSTDGPVIEIELLLDDVNALKASVFAKDINDTYLAIASSTITDTAFTPNSVMEISTDNAIQASEYMVDMIPPRLDSYALNLNTDQLLLTFNEPVDFLSVDCSQITIQNNDTAPTASRQLTGCTIDNTDIIDGVKVLVLNLIRSDITAIKDNALLASSRESLFLSFTNGTVTDTSGVPVEPVMQEGTTSFVSDSTRPSLVSFNYDQLLGTISLTFSDVVNAGSFDPTSLTLQHAMYSEEGRTFSPTSSSSTSSMNGYIVILQLSPPDLLRLKSNTGVARDENDTYITFRASLIDDTQGVDVVPITNGKARSVSEFTPDLEPPALEFYNLDLNTGELNITFTDTVNTTTFNVSKLTLLNSNSTSADQQVQLMGGNISRSDDGLQITVKIDADDLNEIKENINLATQEGNTYLRIDSDAVYDLAMNPFLGDDAGMPMVFINDTTEPELAAFSLDMNTGELQLTFDETVYAASINITGITLQNRMSNATQQFTLEMANSTTINSTVVTVSLSQSDIDSINELRSLATEAATTYLSITSDTIQDMNGNSVAERALVVSNYTTDTTPPRVISISLDLDMEVLEFLFSEVVAYNTFDETELTLQSVRNASAANTTSYTLQNSTVRPIDSTVLYLDLSATDLNEIKRLSDLATTPNNTYFVFTSLLVSDTFGNAVVNSSEEEAVRADNFVVDNTSPVLVSFVLDINDGLLMLTFSETVNASTLDISAITIQSSSMSAVESYSLQSSIPSLNDSTLIVVYLDQADLDAIKLFTMLAINENNTYLNLSTGLILDMNRNSFMQAVSKAETVVPDTTSPQLFDYIFDLNEGTIVLNFTEAVDVGSLNITRFILYNSADSNSSVSYRLTNTSGSSDMNGKIFNITISDEDLNAVKASFELATSLNTTYLFFENGSIADTAGNMALGFDNPLQAESFIPDTTRPQLINATFNFNGGLLTLYFSETVDVTTFDPTEVSLQDEMSSPTITLQLNGGDTTAENSTTITVTLLTSDLNQLKNYSLFFTSPTIAFVSVTNETVLDMSGNNLVSAPPSMALMVASVIKDNVRPEVTEFDLDMNNGVLTVYFSETINPNSLDVTQFSLQDQEMNSSMSYNLTGSVSAVWNLTYVVITLTTPDINAIKIRELLATDENSTYLIFTSSGAADYAGNNLVPSNGTQGIAVSEYTPDTTPPELSTFDLDFSGKPQQLMLTFSEPVRSDSVVFDTITFQSVLNVSADNLSEFYTLSGGNVTSTSSDRLSFTVQLPFIDVVNIQSRRMLAINVDSTFISLANGTVLDMAYNPSSSRSDEAGLQASNYHADTENPSLETFTYDADQGVLILTFSEAVAVSSFTVDGELTIQQAPGNPSSLPGKRLEGGTISESDWYIVNVTLTTTDFDTLRIQVPYNLCTNTTNCFISSTTSGFVSDTTGLQVAQVVDNSAIQASGFIPDDTEPVLEDFSFDVRTLNAILHLTFSEPVKLDFNYSLIEFHNAGSISTSTSMLALTGGTATSAASSFTYNFNVPPSSSFSVTNTVEVDIAVTKTDLDLLLSDVSIGTNVNNTFLFFYSGALTDMYDNDVDEMGGQTVQASSVLPDATPPELSSFSFDLNNGLLFLTFSETVNASSLDPTAITLQSSSSSTMYSYTLTGGNATTEDTPEVTLQLTVDDLNEIKQIAELATSLTNTYLSAEAETIYDMAGFNLTIIPNDTARIASGFVQDTTNPVLLSFALNLTSEQLVLTFDETISYSSVVLRLLTLHSGANGSAINLTDSSTVSENNSTIITIFLSTQDLNRIKLNTNLAVSDSSTYLTIAYETVQDMAAVPNLGQTLLTDNFTADMNNPYLETFLFDLDEGLITLNFNEAVNASSVNVSLMSFLDTANGSIIFVPEALNINSTNGPRLRLFLTTDDLNKIKQNTSLYTAMANTYLNLDEGFVLDLNNNPLEPASNVIALNFTEDIGSPMLTSFDFDLNEGLLSLVFSETVNASSFNPSGITIQSVHNATIPTDQYTLTGGLLTSLVDSTILTLQVTTVDLDIIKARGIALENVTTWLTMTSNTVLDMSGNSVTPIVNNFDAEPVSEYEPDVTSPVLVNFTLDLTQELLLLTFSETVDATSVNATQFTLLNTPMDIAPHNYTLTSDSRAVSPHGPMITISLGVNDLNEIKKLTGLATSTLDTFLALTDMAAFDRSENLVEPREGPTSLQAAVVIEDLQRPMLEQFTFDLDEGHIIFTFSETVNASSLDISQITLLSSNNTNATSYTLTGGAVLSEDGPELTLMLSFYDLNEIKHQTDLMTGVNNESSNSYLTITPSAIRDNDGNAVTMNSALRAQLFISDTTRPELIQFHLDLNTGVLTLNFTEAVNSSSLAYTGLILLNNNTDDLNATSEVELTNVTVIAVNQSWISVNITQSDLNEIKAYLDLATNINNTFLTIDAATILDTSENPVVEINDTDAIPVSDLTPDTTRPVLESYDLDMDNGELILTFSESVLSHTLTPTAFTLQVMSSLALVDSQLYYTLMSTNVTVTAVDHTVVSLLINNSDLNQIKKRSQLATAQNNTFLSLTENAINDTSSNKLMPILPSNGLPVTNYTRDITPPKLASFDFDLNNGQLTLRFTETVNKSSLRLNYYEFASDNTTNATTYALTGNNATISSP